MSVLRFQHFSYLPAPAWLLSLHPHLVFLPQWFLSPRNPRSIPPSLCYSKSLFLVFPLLLASFCIASYAMHLGLGLIEHPNRTCLNWLAVVVMLIDWLICCIGRLKWHKVLIRSIDHCRLCWFCCWVRCWMLQGLDDLKASCVIYVQVDTCDRLE